MNEHSDRSRLKKDLRRTKIVDRIEQKRIEIESGSIEADGRWIDKQKNGSTRAKKTGSTDKKSDRTKKMDKDRSRSKHQNRIDGRKNWIEPKLLIEIVSLNGSKFDFYLNIKFSFLLLQKKLNLIFSLPPKFFSCVVFN